MRRLLLSVIIGTVAAYAQNVGGSISQATTGGGSGTVTNVATTGPITGGPITTTGTVACPTCTTAAAALTSGQLLLGAAGQALAIGNLSGDVSTSGSAVTTLATVNATTGSCGDATHICQVTTNGKGLVTSQAAVGVSPPVEAYNTPVASGNATVNLTLATPAVNTLYRLSLSMVQMDLGTSCTASSTVTLGAGYTDAENNTAYTPAWSSQIIQGGGNAVTSWSLSTSTLLGSTGEVHTYPRMFNVKAGTSLTLTATYVLGTGCTVGPKFTMHPILEVL